MRMTYRESLRDIEVCLRAQCSKLYHFGIRSTVAHNTLANANAVRDWRIYADFAQSLIGIAGPLYAQESFGVDLQETDYALDTTTIELCLSVFPWAPFRSAKAAIKLHTLLDLRGNIPTFRLFIQARGVLKKELLGHLRSKRRIRRSQQSRVGGQFRGQIVDAISIRERPAEIEDRAIPGHCEGDLIGGTRNSHIATLVERHSRFTAPVKVPSKDTAAVVAALSRQIRKLPASLRRSLTWDRGLEMAKHKTFTVATNVKVYFCDPHSPWQRGTNENTNRLLRQYFPKRTDLSSYAQSDLDRVALRLNQRPRKTLGFQTPASRLPASVASTH